jgi:hypothetical protein
VDPLVISPKTNGIIHVILGEGDEYLPEKLNRENICVYRRDRSTNNQLVTVKAVGVLAGPELLRPEPGVLTCNYSGDGNPLHQHADGKWWHYDADWSLEHGPFDTYEEAYGALETYCQNVQTAKEFLTTVEKFVNMVSDETLEQLVEDAAKSTDDISTD